MANEFQNYLQDVFRELLDQAREAKGRATAAKRASAPAQEFEAGRALGYYEVVSHLVNQLDAFAIDRTSVGIQSMLDLDKELL